MAPLILADARRMCNATNSKSSPKYSSSLSAGYGLTPSSDVSGGVADRETEGGASFSDEPPSSSSSPEPSSFNTSARGRCFSAADLGALGRGVSNKPPLTSTPSSSSTFSSAEPDVFRSSSGGSSSPSNTCAVTRATRSGGMPPGERYASASSATKTTFSFTWSFSASAKASTSNSEHAARRQSKFARRAWSSSSNAPRTASVCAAATTHKHVKMRSSRESSTKPYALDRRQSRGLRGAHAASRASRHAVLDSSSESMASRRAARPARSSASERTPASQPVAPPPVQRSARHALSWSVITNVQRSARR
mmetsp:Transcript_27559/g.85109  ORF Transcript_27559/g.85109 Transcript_27559/m.85109 type:complete len:308 (-) Transcript_27559:102-1025(-)